MNIAVQNRRHLTTLDFRYPLIRVKDEYVQTIAMATAFYGGRSCITGSGAQYYRLFITFSQCVIQKTAEQLQCEVLEGQCRAVKKLHNPLVGTELVHGCDSLMVEPGITVINHLPELYRFQWCRRRKVG